MCFCLTLCGNLPTAYTGMGLKHRGEPDQWERSSCDPQISHGPLERKYRKSEVLARNMVCGTLFWFYINVANLWPKGITHLHLSVCI